MRGLVKLFDVPVACHLRSKAKVGKVHVNLDSIIGQQYGVQFELGQNGRDISIKRHKSDRYRESKP